MGLTDLMVEAAAFALATLLPVEFDGPLDRLLLQRFNEEVTLGAGPLRQRADHAR